MANYKSRNMLWYKEIYNKIHCKLLRKRVLFIVWYYAQQDAYQYNKNEFHVNHLELHHDFWHTLL
jgi:hypothetical protein